MLGYIHESLFSELSAEEIEVLRFFYSYVRHERYTDLKSAYLFVFFVSWETICVETNLSPKKVKSAITKLRLKHYITDQEKYLKYLPDYNYLLDVERESYAPLIAIKANPLRMTTRFYESQVREDFKKWFGVPSYNSTMSFNEAFIYILTAIWPQNYLFTHTIVADLAGISPVEVRSYLVSLEKTKLIKKNEDIDTYICMNDIISDKIHKSCIDGLQSLLEWTGKKIHKAPVLSIIKNKTAK